MIRAILNDAFVVLATAVCGSIGALGGLIRLHWRTNYRYSTRYWGLFLMKACGTRLRVENAETVDFDRPRVFMTNHRSHWDTPVLAASIPTPLSFIAKIELAKIPILGQGMKGVGMIFLDRRDPEKARLSLQKAAAILREGRSVMMFPEGSRSEDGRSMRPFKKGGFHLALESGLPIQPVVLLGTERILPKYKLLVRSGPVTARFGREITIRPDSTVESLMTETREEMERLLTP